MINTLQFAGHKPDSNTRTALFIMSGLIDDIRKKVISIIIDAGMSQEDIASMCDLDKDWSQAFFNKEAVGVTAGQLLQLLSLTDNDYSDSIYKKFTELREQIDDFSFAISTISPDIVDIYLKILDISNERINSRLANYYDSIVSPKSISDLSTALNMLVHNPKLFSELLDKKNESIIAGVSSNSEAKIIETNKISLRFMTPFLVKQDYQLAKQYSAEEFIRMQSDVMRLKQMSTRVEFLKAIGSNLSASRTETANDLSLTHTFLSICMDLNSVKKYVLGDKEYKHLQSVILKQFEDVYLLLVKQKKIDSSESLWSILRLNNVSSHYKNGELNAWLVNYLLILIGKEFGLEIPNKWEEASVEKYLEDISSEGLLEMINAYNGKKITGVFFLKFGFTSTIDYLRATKQVNEKIRELFKLVKADNTWAFFKAIKIAPACCFRGVIYENKYLGYEVVNKIVKATEIYLKSNPGQLSDPIKQDCATMSQQVNNAEAPKNTVEGSTQSQELSEAKEEGCHPVNFVVSPRSNLKKHLKASGASNQQKNKGFTKFGFDSQDEFNDKIIALNKELISVISQLVPKYFKSVYYMKDYVSRGNLQYLHKLFAENIYIGYESASKHLDILRSVLKGVQVNSEILTNSKDVGSEKALETGTLSISADVELVSEKKHLLNCRITEPEIITDSILESSQGGEVAPVQPKYILTEEIINSQKVEISESYLKSLLEWAVSSFEQNRYVCGVLFQIEDEEMKLRILKILDPHIKESKILFDIYASKFPGEAMAYAKQQRQAWDELAQTLNPKSKNK